VHLTSCCGRTGCGTTLHWVRGDRGAATSHPGGGGGAGSVGHDVRPVLPPLVGLLVVLGAGAGAEPKGTIAWAEFLDYWNRLCVEADVEAGVAHGAVAAPMAPAVGLAPPTPTLLDAFIPPAAVHAPPAQGSPGPGPSSAAPGPRASVKGGPRRSGRSSVAARAGAGTHPAASPLWAASWAGGDVPLTTQRLWDESVASAIAADTARLDAIVARCKYAPCVQWWLLVGVPLTLLGSTFDPEHEP
jgi:hypothetical protein